MKQLLIVIFFALTFMQLRAQSDIQTKMLFSENSPVEFTSEWQYLSTDIYLLNTPKFDRLINEIDNTQCKFLKKKNEIEFLTITTQLKNLKYFGNSEIVYPIYNYKVGKEKNKAADTRSSNAHEVIRLIDNLPVSTVEDVVEANIEGRAVTRNRKSEFLTVVSDQLINISKFRSPTDAAFYLVGEMGQYMKSLISSTDYQFSTTIRLFEGKNFSQKLHSIKVYALLPPEKQASFRTTGLSRLVQTPDNEVNRKILEENIRYSDYPLIVVVNYKSKYKMPVIVGEEITPELIAQRKNQMKSNYDNGLINDAIYRQEVAFTEFLEKFSYLNKNLESYTLALQMGNPMYISQTLFDIITNYREMLSLKQNREVEFNGLSAYDNIFKPEYESILRNAGVYMEKDRNLKSCRTIAENLYRMNSDETYFLDGNLRENFLSAFYAIDLPDEAYMQASVVGKEIQAQINIMENKHFRAVFLPQIHRLKNMELNDSALHYRNHLLESINHSNCKVCKDKALEEIRAFDERYKAGQIAFEMATKDSLVKAANSVLFALFKKEECLSKNLETYRVDPPIWYSMIKEQHNQLKAQLSLLEVVLSASGDITASHPKDITDYNTHVQRLTDELKHGYSDICNKLDSLCRCQGEE